MPVKALKVATVKEHPNADTLCIYEFAGVDNKAVVVVANSENVYQEGDVVAVALIGAILKDGTKIHKRSFRGVSSYGMALGATDAEIGADLTSEFCHPDYAPELTATHIAWPSIELLHNVIRNMEKRREYMGQEFLLPTVSYRAKIKLHGTNGAVQIVGGNVVAQSRTVILESGGAGFHQWVLTNRELFLTKSLPGKHLTIFGEWCGPGVQRGVAISEIDRKIFAVFGAQIGIHQDAILEVRPDVLRELVPEHPDIFVLPWHPTRVTLNFSLDGKTEFVQAVEDMNTVTSEIEREDPWVRDVFGVSGTGEGLVWYPDPSENLPWYCPYHEMLFKTKGDKHAVVKQKKPAQIAPELVENIEGFLDLFVTKNRLEQVLLTSLEGTLTRKEIGTFLKAFLRDVQKESKEELEAAGLDWEKVSKEVINRARAWFFEQLSIRNRETTLSSTT